MYKVGDIIAADLDITTMEPVAPNAEGMPAIEPGSKKVHFKGKVTRTIPWVLVEVTECDSEPSLVGQLVPINGIVKNVRKDAHGLLKEPVAVGEPLSLVDRKALMRLSLTERNRILAEQAEKMVGHYEQDTEWRELSGGDFVDY